MVPAGCPPRLTESGTTTASCGTPPRARASARLVTQRALKSWAIQVSGSRFMPNSWARVASLLSPVGSGWTHHAGTSPLAAGIVMTTAVRSVFSSTIRPMPLRSNCGEAELRVLCGPRVICTSPSKARASEAPASSAPTLQAASTSAANCGRASGMGSCREEIGFQGDFSLYWSADSAANFI